MKISIPLPVRVTVGRAWGSLVPYEEFVKQCKTSPVKQSPNKSGSNSSASTVLI